MFSLFQFLPLTITSVLWLLISAVFLPWLASFGSPFPIFTCSLSGHPWALALLPTHGWQTPGPTHLEVPQLRNPGGAAAPAILIQMIDTTMVRSSNSLKGVTPTPSPKIQPSPTLNSHSVSFLGHTEGL